MSGWSPSPWMNNPRRVKSSAVPQEPTEETAAETLTERVAERSVTAEVRDNLTAMHDLAYPTLPSPYAGPSARFEDDVLDLLGRVSRLEQQVTDLIKAQDLRAQTRRPR